MQTNITAPTGQVVPFQTIDSNVGAEIDWVSRVIEWRAANRATLLSFEGACAPPDRLAGALARFVKDHLLNEVESFVLSFLMAAQLDDTILQILNLPQNPARLTLYEKTGALLPTIETVLFVLGGDRFENKSRFKPLFSPEHLFYKKSVIDIEEAPRCVPEKESVIFMRKSYFDLFTLGRFNQPRFSQEFPAHLLETRLDWEDLILNDNTQERLEELKSWLRHAELLRNDPQIGKHYKPGYRCLFYGPPGTGKSLAATLLGKHLGRDVYRVDLSAIISKYIGETSKNLNELFNRAEDKDWILFFDEGDALFSKRVNLSDADNKNATFANQDVAFLLQRMEAFNGLLIVATNFEKNLDPAFSRRFNQLIPFEQPNPDNALRIWKEHLPAFVTLAQDVNLELLIKRYSLSAASIINVLQRAAMAAIRKDNGVITAASLNKLVLDETYHQKAH